MWWMMILASISFPKVLPLPVDHGHRGSIGELSSRRARQRVNRRRVLLQREEETVRGINFLAGFEREEDCSGPSGPCSAGSASR